MKKILTALIIIQMMMPLQVMGDQTDKVVRGILISTPNQRIVRGIPVVESTPVYQPVYQPVQQTVVVPAPVPVVYREVGYERDDSEAETFGAILGLTALFAILSLPFGHYHNYSHHSFHHGR